MKKIPYATQFIDSSDVNAVEKVLQSGFLTQGPEVAKFEKLLAGFCGVKYAVAVNSGTSALHIACMAAGMKPGDEGITSPITFAASSNAMLFCGARPVFADVHPGTVTIDPAQALKKVTKRTKVIIPVDFAGSPAALAEIYCIARKCGITVIEDAAHSLGATYKSGSSFAKTGSCRHSDMAILSFHAVKHITTGEGGMVLTNNEKLFKLLSMLRTHGITRDPDLMTESQGGWYYEMHALGYNYRITDFQCALGSSQFRKLASFVKKRREIVSQYRDAFSKFEGLGFLEEPAGAKSAHHIFVLRFKEGKFKASRREIFDEYRANGIFVNVHYIPVYLQPYYRKMGYKPGSCPEAEKYYREAITLPLYPAMKNSDVSRVINVTNKIVGKYGK